jgi:hypothetical protein
MTFLTSVLFTALGGFEFFNAFKIIEAGTAAGAIKGFGGLIACPAGAEAVYGRVYAFFLISLGVVRLTHALDTSAWIPWLMCVLFHVAESAFWWGEAIASYPAVLKSQDFKSEETGTSASTEVKAKEIMKALTQPAAGHVLQKVVLLGPPALTVVCLLLSNPMMSK